MAPKDLDTKCENLTCFTGMLCNFDDLFVN